MASPVLASPIVALYRGILLCPDQSGLLSPPHIKANGMAYGTETLEPSECLR